MLGYVHAAQHGRSVSPDRRLYIELTVQIYSCAFFRLLWCLCFFFSGVRRAWGDFGVLRTCACGIKENGSGCC